MNHSLKKETEPLCLKTSNPSTLTNGQHSPMLKRLPLQTMALFDSPHEWCLIDFLYFRSNLKQDFICRLSTIRKNTPLKVQETIIATLNRMVVKGWVTKSTHPLNYRKNKYIFNRAAFDEWLATASGQNSEQLALNGAKVSGSISDQSLVRIPTSVDTKSDQSLVGKQTSVGPNSDHIRNIKEKEKDLKEAPEGAGTTQPDTEMLDLNLPCGPVPRRVLETVERNYRTPATNGTVNIKSSGHSASGQALRSGDLERLESPIPIVEEQTQWTQYYAEYEALKERVRFGSLEYKLGFQELMAKYPVVAEHFRQQKEKELYGFRA